LAGPPAQFSHDQPLKRSEITCAERLVTHHIADVEVQTSPGSSSAEAAIQLPYLARQVYCGILVFSVVFGSQVDSGHCDPLLFDSGQSAGTLATS
jgi:hypothetical protein